MKVLAAELVELDDATCWVRVGDRMARIEVPGWLSERPAPIAPPIPATIKEQVPAPKAPPAPKSPAPVAKGTRVPAEKWAKYDELRAGGAKVSVAARAALIDPMRAYAREKKRKAKGEAPAGGVKRRCDGCQAVTLTDPCGNCGAGWDRKKVTR